MIHVSHNVEKKLSLLNLFIKANARSQSNPRVETFFVKIIMWRQIAEKNSLCNVSSMS